MVDESLGLGQDLKLELEVRPVSDSGLLLHTGARKGQQLSVYLDQGKVSALLLQTTLFVESLQCQVNMLFIY